MSLRHALLLSLLLVAAPLAGALEFFAIRVVDEDTGRGVPLVELRTVHDVRYYTDSAGLVAFYEPGLAGQEVYFHIRSHGYEYPADGFGYRGARLRITPGGHAELKIKRLNIAERLYRVTGGGIYRDSVLLGRPVPLEHPVLNGLVFGQDSVINAVYHGRLYWFWGDTSRPAYPLGNFQVAGATSQLPSDGGLSPEIGVNLTCFVDERGFAKQMAPVPGPAPTWIDGLIVLRDQKKRERLYAVYAKVRQDMSANGRGFLVFDDDAQQFLRIAEFDPNAPVQPGGHPFLHTDAGVEYVCFTRPFPVIRVPATPDAFPDLDEYECFTCLKPGCTTEKPELDRAADGTLTWRWKRGVPQLLPRKQEELLAAGQMKLAEARFRLHDVDTGQPVVMHGGSVYFNAYRRRWVAIVSQILGTSVLGEIWLAEADTPTGPWRYARKIVTHDRYSFYNPKQHPMFDQDGGRVIYFEGTYTATFSGNPEQTPWYNYNQIMYRVDLADPRLVLPVAVYAKRDGAFALGAAAATEGGAMKRPAFFALDRPVADCVAVCQERDADARWQLRRTDPAGVGFSPVFYALPSEAKDPPPTTVPLYALTSDDGRWAYATEESEPPSGFHRVKPLCRVWRLWPAAGSAVPRANQAQH